MAGPRALRDRSGRRLRVPGEALQVALRHCARDYRHPLEWVGVLWAQEPERFLMKKSIIRKLRCAVYPRKSSEEGLEQDFNSLDAQRKACEAYLASQKAEG